MALFNCNELAGITQSATAGILGGASRLRSSQSRFSVRGSIATYTIPATTPQIGDSLELIPLMTVTSKFLIQEIRSDALGAGALVSSGKIDQNNAANTDTVHYMDPTDFSLGGKFSAGKNILEQVGADPLGDQSTGNATSGDGSEGGNAAIIPTLTFTGAAPSAAANITVMTLFAED